MINVILYSKCPNSSMFVGFFKIIDQVKPKANQIYLKPKKIQDAMSIRYQKN